MLGDKRGKGVFYEIQAVSPAPAKSLAQLSTCLWKPGFLLTSLGTITLTPPSCISQAVYHRGPSCSQNLAGPHGSTTSALRIRIPLAWWGAWLHLPASCHLVHDLFPGISLACNLSLPSRLHVPSSHLPFCV